MSHKYKLFRTLTDYQQFLHHSDPIIRSWAKYCVSEQYPDQTAASFAHLLTDSDSHLQISAATAIGQQRDSRFEPALRAAWPNSKGGVRRWFTVTLGQLRSSAILPELITALDALPTEVLPTAEGVMGGITWQFPHSAAEALGYYPDNVARAALWRLLERYPANDRLTFNLIKGLLRHIRPDEMPRLLQRLGEFEPDDNTYWYGLRALSEAANLSWLIQQLDPPLIQDWIYMLNHLEAWFLTEISFSELFEDALDHLSAQAYIGILPPMLTELERIATERNDDLSGWTMQWQAGQRPTGYQWRMVFAHQLFTAIAAHPPPQPKTYQETVALGLALLGQAVVDQDDAAALQAAPNEMFRQATLLSILDSGRQNVLPDIVEQVASLGPAIVPHLIETLEGDNIWAWLRALAAIKQIARAFPGATDAAVPAILNLIDPDQSDEVLKNLSSALIAIGPGALDAIAPRLGQDYVYDIYAGSVLAHTPTEASVEIWLTYLLQKANLDEMDWDYLVNLGHPAALSFLRDNCDWRNDSHLCTALYTLAVVTGYSGPELRHWQTVARKDYLSFKAELDKEWSAAETTPKKQATKKQKKQKRKWTKNQRKKQQQKRKKKKR